MKKLILLIFILAHAPAHAEEKPFLNDLEIGGLGLAATMAACVFLPPDDRPDLSSHCYYAFVPSVAGTIAFKKAEWGFGIGCGLTLLKEVIDHNKWLNENSVAAVDDATVGCGAALSGAYFTERVVVYQHRLDTGVNVELIKKPNIYFGAKLAFSTGQYY